MDRPRRGKRWQNIPTKVTHRHSTFGQSRLPSPPGCEFGYSGARGFGHGVSQLLKAIFAYVNTRRKIRSVVGHLNVTTAMTSPRGLGAAEDALIGEEPGFRYQYSSHTRVGHAGEGPEASLDNIHYGEDAHGAHRERGKSL
jgi:hypothetical protein